MPATVSMAEIVSEVVAGLRSAMTAPVEEYWRLEPPRELTCYVQPKQELPEKGVGIGQSWASGFELSIIIEVPWDDKVATGAALSGAVDEVKAWVSAHRSVAESQAGSYIARYGAIDYVFVSRPGGSVPVFSAIVPLTLQWPG